MANKKKGFGETEKETERETDRDKDRDREFEWNEKVEISKANLGNKWSMQGYILTCLLQV